jgi:hypothetical protein
MDAPTIRFVVEVTEHRDAEGSLDNAAAEATVGDVVIAKTEARTTLGALRGATAAALDVIGTIHWRDVLLSSVEQGGDATRAAP